MIGPKDEVKVKTLTNTIHAIKIKEEKHSFIDHEKKNFVCYRCVIIRKLTSILIRYFVRNQGSHAYIFIKKNL